jgi:hypothetical protein
VETDSDKDKLSDMRDLIAHACWSCSSGAIAAQVTAVGTVATQATQAWGQSLATEVTSTTSWYTTCWQVLLAVAIIGATIALLDWLKQRRQRHTRFVHSKGEGKGRTDVSSEIVAEECQEGPSYPRYLLVKPEEQNELKAEIMRLEAHSKAADNRLQRGLDLASTKGEERFEHFENRIDNLELHAVVLRDRVTNVERRIYEREMHAVELNMKVERVRKTMNNRSHELRVYIEKKLTQFQETQGQHRYFGKTLTQATSTSGGARGSHEPVYGHAIQQSNNLYDRSSQRDVVSVPAPVSDDDSCDADRQVHDPAWLNRARKQTIEARIAQLEKIAKDGSGVDRPWAEDELARFLDQQCADDIRQSPFGGTEAEFAVFKLECDRAYEETIAEEGAEFHGDSDWDQA